MNDDLRYRINALAREANALYEDGDPDADTLLRAAVGFATVAVAQSLDALHTLACDQLERRAVIEEQAHDGCENSAEARITAALTAAAEYGVFEGDHHRAFAIDQIVRALTGDKYQRWVSVIADEWDEGIAP